MNLGTDRRQGRPSPFEPENHASSSVACCSGRSPEIAISDAPAQYRESLQKMFQFTKFNRMQVSPHPLNDRLNSAADYDINQSQMVGKTLLCDSSIILAAPTGSGQDLDFVTFSHIFLIPLNQAKPLFLSCAYSDCFSKEKEISRLKPVSNKPEQKIATQFSTKPILGTVYLAPSKFLVQQKMQVRSIFIFISNMRSLDFHVMFGSRTGSRNSGASQGFDVLYLQEIQIPPLRIVQLQTSYCRHRKK